MSKPLAEISVLMISLDPDFLRSDSVVVHRHQEYATQIKKLNILLLANSPQNKIVYNNNLTVYPVGRGWRAIRQALIIGRQVLGQDNFDLIDTQDPHMTGYIGSRLARQFHKPLEIHFHGDFWNNNHWLKESWKNIIYNYLQKKLVREASGIRVVSQKIKDKLVADNVNADKIAVINTPVSTQHFGAAANAEAVRKIKAEYPKKILLFVGRLVAAKNILFLLEAVAELKKRRDDFAIILIGDGQQKNKILLKIDALKLNKDIALLGAKEPSHLRDYYAASYLNLLLSTNESFGKVIIEAGWQGKATLASDTLGAQTIIVDNQTGWLVPINNLAMTVNKLDLLLSDHVAVEQAGQNAQKLYREQYDPQKTTQNILAFWQKILNKN